MTKSDKTETNWININRDQDPDVMDLISEFADLQHLKPTTALKQFLLQNLPAKIQAFRADATPSVDKTEKSNPEEVESQGE